MFEQELLINVGPRPKEHPGAAAQHTPPTMHFSQLRPHWGLAARVARGGPWHAECLDLDQDH